MDSSISEVQKLFPNEHELADLILSEMGLQTSLEQVGRKVQASYRRSISYVSGDKEGVEGASAEIEVYREINPLNDLKLLYEREKVKVEQALTTISKRHNQYLEKLIQKFPKLTNIMWEVFKRTRFIDENTANLALNPNPEEIKRARQRPYCIVSETDEEFTSRYLWLNSIHLPQNIKEKLNETPALELIEFDAKYPFGLNVGRYAFAKLDQGTRDIFQTIWDLRQPQIPFFKVAQ
jgi:hypothetical protein